MEQSLLEKCFYLVPQFFYFSLDADVVIDMHIKQGLFKKIILGNILGSNSLHGTLGYQCN